MDAIKITRACAVAGAAQKVGALLVIGKDITIGNARRLIQLRRAVEAEKPKPKPKPKANDG